MVNYSEETKYVIPYSQLKKFKSLSEVWEAKYGLAYSHPRGTGKVIHTIRTRITMKTASRGMIGVAIGMLERALAV